MGLGCLQVVQGGAGVFTGSTGWGGLLQVVQGGAGVLQVVQGGGKFIDCMKEPII